MVLRDPGERLQFLLNHLDDCNCITPINRGEGDQTWRNLIKQRCPTQRGIYVFYSNRLAKYVGRSDNIIQRITGHRSVTREGLPSRSATLARIIAKERFRIQQNRNEAPFSLQLSRAFGALDPAQQREFLTEAIQYVRQMQVKVVEVLHAHEQAVFEVYVHDVWGTPYNSFRNH